MGIVSGRLVLQSMDDLTAVLVVSKDEDVRLDQFDSAYVRVMGIVNMEDGDVVLTLPDGDNLLNSIVMCDQMQTQTDRKLLQKGMQLQPVRRGVLKGQHVARFGTAYTPETATSGQKKFFKTAVSGDACPGAALLHQCLNSQIQNTVS
jgi:hypothetical protein